MSLNIFSASRATIGGPTVVNGLAVNEIENTKRNISPGTSVFGAVSKE